MLTTESLRQRLIRKSDLVANEAAFIDYRIPGCNPKHNYALIGPGVAQGDRQFVNLRERHGFNVGAVNVPHGVTNPLHLHFTAEVFVCYRGEWTMQWGTDEDALEARIGEGDLFSPPAWIYRGFRNVGTDDGFLFTVLGGDDTGGILWAPSVVRAAQTHGLYLTDDFRIIDTVLGQTLAPTDRLFEPMSAEDIAKLRRYSIAEMAGRIVRHADLAWSERALLGAMDAGVALAPAIGHGITEDRDHRPPITDPHGFSVEWLRAAPGATLPVHRLTEKQVLIAKTGGWSLRMTADDGEAAVTLGAWDTLAVPAGVWRSLTNETGDAGLLLLVTSGEGRNRIEWSPTSKAAAAASGWAHDANGYCAPRRLVESAQK
jgi:quercetin dioxygenase-like cupin family protein